MHRHLLVAGAACVLTPAVATAGTSADEVRSIVAEMMADAQTRSSLLQSGGSAGYDGGFMIAGAGGDYALKIKALLQTRYTAFIQDDQDNPAFDDFQGGFSQPRARLAFTGNAVSEKLVYKIQGEFGSVLNGGTFNLLDAYVGYNFDNGWGLYGGQVRLPVLWEDVISQGGGQLAVDASITNEVFNPGYSQAAWLHYSDEAWRGWFAFSDGAGSANTDFNASPADYALTTRIEFLFDGNWGQFNTMSSMPGSDFGAKLGLAVHYQDGANTPAGGEAKVIPYSADLMLQGDGWNVYGAFIGRYIEINGVAGDLNDYGVVLQGGMFIPDTDWELFARYDGVFVDDDYANNDNFNTLTVGTNWFWHGQAARFTFDVQYYFDSTVDSDPVNGVAAGTGPDVSLVPTVDDGAVALRAQFQLLF